MDESLLQEGKQSPMSEPTVLEIHHAVVLLY